MPDNFVPKPPTHKILIGKKIRIQGQERMKWHEVGAGWQNQKGNISFNLITMPGVNLYVFPASSAEAQSVGKGMTGVERDIDLGPVEGE